MGLDTQDSAVGARAFYRKFGWHHPSITDLHGSIAHKLGVQGVPTTFFLNQRHYVVAEVAGATNLAGFEQGLRAALHHS